MEENEFHPWILYLSQIISQAWGQKDGMGRNARFQVPFLKKVLEDVLRQNVE